MISSLPSKGKLSQVLATARRSFLRRIRSRLYPQSLILLYHRVTELPSDPQLLSVTPTHFAEHLEILHKYTCPLTLQQLVQGLREGHIPNQAVVITFDDGYADNLYQAKPLLEQYKVPATVFVTSGYVGQSDEFWWDELDRLLLQPGVLPEILSLNINNNSWQWELREAANYSQETYQRYRHWHMLEQDTPSPRQRLYRSLGQLLRPLPVEERLKTLTELQSWTGAKPEGRLTHRALSPDEVCQLTAGGLIEVGAHTVTHPILSTLSPALQQVEIEQSKAQLERILGRPILSFSYPYGARSDYTSRTIDLVRKAGFECACSNFADTVWSGIDCFQLPRFLVRDWDGAEFARQLQTLLSR